MYKIDIIIVNYNNFHDTIECLKSLENNEYKDYRVIIVDNASQNESVEKLEQYIYGKDNMTVIALEENIGFAGGNNVAIGKSIEDKIDAVLLLNNDTEVEPDFLVKLVEGWNANTLRAPLIYNFYNKKEVWYAAGKFNKKKCIAENGNYKEYSKVSFISGCCALIPINVIKNIGLLKEEYFMYCEDAEYSLRCEKYGIEMEYIPDSIIYHKDGGSSGGDRSKLSIYYNNRNRFYLLDEYKLGKFAYAYTYITRMCRLLVSLFVKSNDRVIKDAYKDYKKGVRGKVK